MNAGASSNLPFTGPWLLAPMEGVTEPCFRDAVLERHAPETLGGAFTEFLRVTDVPRGERQVRAWLGPRRHPQPVGLQLMGAEAGPLAETTANAFRAGAPLVDINFGCPSKGALRGCAGSALLDRPERVESLVRACASAAEGRPVSAKIRAGGEDDLLLEELACAVEAGGARMLTVHCRTRREGYGDCADWDRIARAVAAVRIAVCGNGGIDAHADGAAMLARTGCRYVMVGRAALADPWVFSGRTVDSGEAARFLLDYAVRLDTEGDLVPKAVAGRVKQLLAHWTAADLVTEDRRSWLREREPEVLLGRLRDLAEAERAPGSPTR